MYSIRTSGNIRFIYLPTEVFIVWLFKKNSKYYGKNVIFFIFVFPFLSRPFFFFICAYKGISCIITKLGELFVIGFRSLCCRFYELLENEIQVWWWPNFWSSICNFSGFGVSFITISWGTYYRNVSSEYLFVIIIYYIVKNYYYFVVKSKKAWKGTHYKVLKTFVRSLEQSIYLKIK